MVGPPGQGGGSSVRARKVAAVHHRLVTDDQAPALLQGAYDLLELQMERMQLEDGIRSAHPAALSP